MVWFRLDLRLDDNPALHAALRCGLPILPVFIWSPAEESPWAPGAASRWWLHQSLNRLDQSLRLLGGRLVIRQGSSPAVLRELVERDRVRAVFWNRRSEPALATRDREIREILVRDNVHVEDFNSALLHEPRAILNKSGDPFQVFTPFWRTCLAQPDPAPSLPCPERLPGPRQWPSSLKLADLNLEPRLGWAEGIRQTWTPGEAGAQAALRLFLREGYAQYDADRDRPDLQGTSRLSPHLHFGEISPRQIWHAAREHSCSLGSPPDAWRRSRFLTELGWREFAHHLLLHYPHTPEEPLRPKFNRFPWRQEASWLQAWQRGLTGYPLVDAGMRELWKTGWMHNRVRMVVGSFLVKHLLINWREGVRWFWDTLVDADLANNTLGWQWISGCGADAAPFFRIFNPVSQGEKFDAAGAYVRRWIPELNRLPAAWIHQPWLAPPEILAQAGVCLDRTYPRPVVSHAIAREVALEAYARLKG